MDSLPFLAERYLDDAAIVLYVPALDQILGHQLVNHMRSGAERYLQDASQFGHGQGVPLAKRRQRSQLQLRAFRLIEVLGTTHRPQPLSRHVHKIDELPDLFVGQRCFFESRQLMQYTPTLTASLK